MPRVAKGDKVTAQKTQETHKELNIHNIFVFHIGSLNLYYGRASDSTPMKMNFAIARKKIAKNGHASSSSDTNSIINFETTSFDKSLALKSQTECLKVISSLKNSFKSQQISFTNVEKPHIEANQMETQSKKSFEKSFADLQPKLKRSSKSDIIGDDVFNASLDEYTINWPVYGGDFNTKSYNNSMESILSDIEEIIGHVLYEKLYFNPEFSEAFRVVVLVPDNVSKPYMSNLSHVFLDRLKIKYLMILQESVCSSFGFGLPTACIVDVGHVKTSISCVEDGFSITNSKIKLIQGGINISTAFYWLLRENEVLDDYLIKLNELKLFKLIDDLKIKNCHLKLNQNNDDCAWTSDCDLSFDSNSYQDHFEMDVKVANALIYPPLSLINCGLCGLKNGSLISGWELSNNGVVDDLLDDKFILDLQFREAPQKKSKDGQETVPDINLSQTELVSIPNSSQPTDLTPTIPNDLSSNAISVLSSLCSETNDINMTTTITNGSSASLNDSTCFGLDALIVSSIESCGNVDTRRKLYESIMVVGGGFSFIGADKVLQNRIKSRLPLRSKNMSDSVEVCMRPKDLEANCVTWKGGSVVSMLDSAQDLWISNIEWTKYGTRIIREKALLQFPSSFDR